MNRFGFKYQFTCPKMSIIEKEMLTFDLTFLSYQYLCKIESSHGKE